ncbi:hypothetical protein A9Q86_01940 [Flavobacteriales bacterium 33_180_T64]|nr:hypothetical protein A9Q86_01940 [Flavobacteriales bacterium 33_180_T64]
MKKLLTVLLILIVSCKQENKVNTKTKNSTHKAIETVKENLAEDTPKAFNLLNIVFKNLDLKKESCKTDLITTQINPNNTKETIVVIPEIAIESEDYLEFNSHILLVNSATGVIKQNYFESSKTNGWVSDAVQLRKITIDTTSYTINDTTNAFGIRVYYANTSRVNPYTHETLSLFKKKKHSLTKILHNFDVAIQRGRWGTGCDSEFTDIITTLIISNKKVNNHFNIIAKNNSAKSITSVDNNGECNSKDTITIKPRVLKFNGVTYKEHEYNNVTFKTLINAIPLKNKPLIDSTNFDNFTATKFYNKEEVLSLKLENIYPNFYKEGYNYKATSSYKLKYSCEFHSIVFTILKGDNEMESVLINYNMSGELIDYKVISYDEITEGWSKIESKIKGNHITINDILWVEEKHQRLKLFEIDTIGNIKRVEDAYNSPETPSTIQIERVIQQLNIDKLKIKEEFVSSKILTHNKDESIVIIPEIASDDDENMYRLNSHIALVNNTTGKITHKYYESSKTSGWESDAIMLSEIAIDTTKYQLNDYTKAFGIQVYNYGLSRVNPYSNRTLSLFVKSGDSLKKVMHHYTILDYSGEWDGVCAGESNEVKNTFSIYKEQANGYFNIQVESTITKSETFVINNDDCDSKDRISTKTRILKFDGETYK